MAECSLAVSFAPLNESHSTDCVDGDYHADCQKALPITEVENPGRARCFVECGKPLPEYEVEIRTVLSGLGIELLSHLPHNGYIVRADRARLEAAASLDFVERVEPYHPSYRLEPELRDWLESGSEEELRVLALLADQAADTMQKAFLQPGNCPSGVGGGGDHTRADIFKMLVQLEGEQQVG